VEVWKLIWWVILFYRLSPDQRVKVIKSRYSEREGSMSQEQIPVEKAKKPGRRRLIIYIVVGVVVICLFCVIVVNFLPSSDDGGEPASPPEEVPTAVQLPEESPPPTNTPLPVVIPTLIPTEIPTEVPVIVEDEVSEYFFGLAPKSFLMASAMDNMSDLFFNPRLLDDDWYDEVTGQMGVLLVTAKEMAETPVPDNCDICSEVNNEIQIIYSHADEATLDWISWLEDKSEAAYLESMATHITEIGTAANNAAAIMDSYLE
jgi:hypothetical protein